MPCTGRCRLPTSRMTHRAPVTVRLGPGGLRGVMLMAPDRFMGLVATSAHRSLTPDECSTYLHRPACPGHPTCSGPAVANVLAASGAVPAAALATGTLAGTRVDVVSQLPIDMTPLAEAFRSGTGIEVVQAMGPDANLDARVASGNLPDVAIVSRPALVAELARERLLVDLSTLIDLDGLRAAAGDYLVELGTVGNDGSWPASQGRLYGAPFATEAESLIWYPKAEFDAAGYVVPRTWDELTALISRMTAEGRTPWCLGLEAGPASGASAAGFVEDIVLHTAGPDVYHEWAAGSRERRPIPRACSRSSGIAPTGTCSEAASAVLTPTGFAALPMFVVPPQCWLMRAGGRSAHPGPRPGPRRWGRFPSRP